ncbi:MAG TPA: hypothetical protein PLN56_09870 [Methanoregulaceae archaeon]|nr:hypothetical protein [Methanoregulaceae archaeon]
MTKCSAYVVKAESKVGAALAAPTDAEIRAVRGPYKSEAQASSILARVLEARK